MKIWDELVKRGATAEKMQQEAESFQAIVLEMLAERKANDAENRVILATHKPKDDARRYHFPNGVEAIEGFDDGPFPAGLAIKALPRDRYILWRELFESTRGQFDYVDEDAAVLEYRERTVTRFPAPEWKDYLAILDANLEKLNQSRPKKHPFLMGIQRLRSALESAGAYTGRALMSTDEFYFVN